MCLLLRCLEKVNKGILPSREQPQLGDLLTMVINNLLTGMILQVAVLKKKYRVILEGTNISHLGKARKSSTQKCRLVGDMLVPRKVSQMGDFFDCDLLWYNPWKNHQQKQYPRMSLVARVSMKVIVTIVSKLVYFTYLRDVNNLLI